MSHRNLKRNVDELEDSEDEEPMLGRQVLPVADLPMNFDGVPMDGMQYLFTVRRDARRLPRVTRVINPYELPEVLPPTAQASDVSEIPTRKSVLPSEEWRETFLRRFKNFRKNSVQPTIHVHIPDSSAKIIPDRKERDMWWAFLAGRPESEWNPPKKPKQPKLSRWQQRNLKMAEDIRNHPPEYADLPYDYAESSNAGLSSSVASSSSLAPVAPGSTHLDTEPGEIAETAPSQMPQQPAAEMSNVVVRTDGDNREVAPVCLPREPTPTLLQSIDHRYALHLLMYFGHWIEVRLENGALPHTDITETHARWIFSLLSRVDDWISGDETSLLRTLARGCMGLVVERRKQLARRGEEKHEGPSMIDEKSCWIIITAISGIWGQADLWIDAESMLSKLDPDPV